MRQLTAAYQTHPRARLAINVFCYRARKYMGAYLAVLEGRAEAVILSGGIGENSPLVRKKILGGMEWCGLTLDDAGNEQAQSAAMEEFPRFNRNSMSSSFTRMKK